MPLRIGFDMDGVLADFTTAYRAVEEQLFGASGVVTRAGDPEEEAKAEAEDAAATDVSSAADQKPPQPARETRAHQRQGETRRRRDAVWRAIHDIPDFWCSLAPTDSAAVRRIHALMMQHRWEVFFITQRPATLGDTVQRQTQRWLVEQGFDLPSVLVIPGSRGAAAGALRLDYHVDDSTKNCIDVIAESGARPLLIIGDPDEAQSTSARRLGIGIASDIASALGILEQATISQTQPTLLNRLAQLVGWR